MKKTLATFVICVLSFLPTTVTAQTCFGSCTNAETGWNVQVISDGNGWEMTIRDETGVVMGTYAGSGSYTGTACSGYILCQI